MSKCSETQQDNLLLFSEMHNEFSSHDVQFISQLHQKYGIPLIQLERVYLSAKSMRSNASEDTTELDYGQKLTLNHNILKQMISIIDSRENIPKNITTYESKPLRRSASKLPPSIIDEKLREVKYKLQELISFIGQQQKKNQQIQIKKVVNLSDINQGSYFDTSLQYSKDIQNQSASKQKNIIVIDRNRLDNAKQVTSQYMIKSTPESEKMYMERQSLMKSSLDRISEVQSGETIERQENKSDLKKTPKKVSQSQINVNRSEGKQTPDRELDETGKIILSTINKKITKTSTITQRDKIEKEKQPRQIISTNQKTLQIKDQVKKSKFWRNNPGKLETLAHNVVISNETIQEPKAFQRSRFKYDHFNNGFTFKSLDSIDKVQRQTSINHNKELQKGIESQEVLNHGNPHFNQQKLLNNLEDHKKKSFGPTFFKQNLLKNSLNDKKINESMILKTFPSNTAINPLYNQSQKFQQRQSFIPSKPQQPKINQQLRNTHFLNPNQSPRVINSLNSISSIKPHSVPHFAYKEVPIIRHIPQASHNHLFRSTSTPLILNNSQTSRQAQVISSHIQHNKYKEKLQSPRLSNPYLSAIQPIKLDPRNRSVVYHNIYDEIINNSDISSDKSGGKAKTNHKTLGAINTIKSLQSLHLNDNKLKKKGIQVTNTIHHNFYNRR